MDRRKLLQSLATGVAVTVAGCGGDTGTPSETPASSPAPTDTADSMDTPAETPAETPTPSPTSPTPADETPTPDRTATPDPTPTPTPVAQTVEVGAGGGFSFAPESFTIAVGDTVEWTWVGPNHNVTPNSIPATSDWTGTPDAPDRTFETGYSYTDTFAVAGEYSYYCDPHRGGGMTGSFTVTE